MSRVKSFEVLLDLECDAFVLDLFHHFVASIKDDHSPPLLAHIESILVGILEEADDLLWEFLVSILSRSQAMGMGCPSLGVCKKIRNREPNRKTEKTEPKNRLTE